jgi:hypothetical protein
MRKTEKERKGMWLRLPLHSSLATSIMASEGSTARMLSSSGHTSVADHTAVPGPDPKSISDFGVQSGRRSLICARHAVTALLITARHTTHRTRHDTHLVHDAKGAGVDAGETVGGVGHGLLAPVDDRVGHH